MPEFDVTVSAGEITCVTVLRGAPCGATWDAAERLIGVPLEEACVQIGIETQYFCTANPANWDPIYDKSPLHFAGELHSTALKRALKKHR